MLPTKLVIIIISTLGLERFNPVPEGIHHRPHLLHSAGNLVLYIGVTDTVQGLVLEFGDLGDIVVKPLQLALDALDLPQDVIRTLHDITFGASPTKSRKANGLTSFRNSSLSMYLSLELDVSAIS